jgi:hypothetical protein
MVRDALELLVSFSNGGSPPQEAQVGTGTEVGQGGLTETMLEGIHLGQLARPVKGFSQPQGTGMTVLVRQEMATGEQEATVGVVVETGRTGGVTRGPKGFGLRVKAKALVEGGGGGLGEKVGLLLLDHHFAAKGPLDLSSLTQPSPMGNK